MRPALTIMLLMLCGLCKAQSDNPGPDLNKSLTRYPDQRFSFAGVTGGEWMPQGSNQILGNHPFFGFLGGVGYNRWLFDIDLEFRVNKASHTYAVQYLGDTVATDHYFGGFLGVNAGFELLRQKDYSIYALAGFGLDGFDAIETQNYNQPSMSINAFAKNVGIGIYHVFEDRTLIAFQAQYSFINYQNPGGTPLDGNGILLRIIIGSLKLK